MGDFYQHGAITTLHNLSRRPTRELEAQLRQWCEQRPIAVVIPALAGELDGAALPAIIDALVSVSYVGEVVIGLDRADPAHFERARALLDALPMASSVVWNDGPRLQALQVELSAQAGVPAERGKGHNVWWSLGYLLGARRTDVVAIHDADVLTYSPDLLARLVYPVVHPGFGYGFSKGYYFRSDGRRLNGRVARLLVSPLLRALRDTLGPSDYLDFIESFRYPLAGECAMEIGVARSLRLPYDWGLEIGMLSELYHRDIEQRVCQVEISGAYDHKHQPMSLDDPGSGLHRMAIDIAKAFFRKLTVTESDLSPSILGALDAGFVRHAGDLARQYGHDAEMNGYDVDAEGDAALIELFRIAIAEGADQHLGDPGSDSLMPSWSKIAAAVPDALDRLVAAVGADNDRS